jgi:hypothetical protein
MYIYELFINKLLFFAEDAKLLKQFGQSIKPYFAPTELRRASWPRARLKLFSRQLTLASVACQA